MSSTAPLAVITGTNPPATALAPAGEPRRIDVDGTTIEVLAGDGFVVLDRHRSTGTTRPAHLVDHGTNVRALAGLGCRFVLAVGSTGGLRADLAVGTVVVPDDFYAPWTTPSLYTDLRGHSVPGFDLGWRQRVVDEWRATSGAVVDGGVYAQTAGPRFETPAEVRALARHADVVGMTIASECIVAKEAGLAYAAVCVVDNAANGVAPTPLTTEEFAGGVAANRAHLVATLGQVIPGLLSTLGDGAASA